MNLNEYLSCRQIKRLPAWSVEISETDEIQIWSITHIYAGKTVNIFAVEIKMFSYVYVCHDDGLLYTQDEHGNLKSPCVFKINPQILKKYVRNTTVPYSR